MLGRHNSFISRAYLGTSRSAVIQNPVINPLTPRDLTMDRSCATVLVSTRACSGVMYTCGT